MNNVTGRHIIYLLVMILLQVVVLKRMETDGYVLKYINIIFYPLGLLLFPIRLSNMALLLIAFFSGLIVDIFYDSIGIHASACVFMAWLRPVVIELLKPREGYNVDISPSTRLLGMSWFIRYTSILMLAYLLFYFSVEAFTFVYLGSILLKTLFSFVATMLFVLFYIFIFDSRET